MQLSGSLSQSVLHRNLSHDSQPIGGVFARPLSKLSTRDTKNILESAMITATLLLQKSRLIFLEIQNKVKSFVIFLGS